MDAMYAEYSGPDTIGSFLHKVRKEAGSSGPGGSGGQFAANVAWNIAEDFVGSFEEEARVRFAGMCRMLGHGDRPAGLAPDERDFFSRADVHDGCRRVVELDVAIEADELKLARLLGRG